MPYLFFKYPADAQALRIPLTRYLSLSGINLRESVHSRTDAVCIVLLQGTPSVRCHPESGRFARTLTASMRSVLPKTTFRQDRSLPVQAVPTAVLSLPETLCFDACARIVTDALRRYFLLPALPDRPEMPARIGDFPARLFTVTDEKSRILQQLDAGSPVTCLGTSGAWSVIRSHNELGFCRTEQLRLF